MNRYKYTTISKTETGKRYYNTTLYPPIEETSHDIYIMTRKGERLDLLAEKYYGTVTAWPVLALANDLDVGTFKLHAGIQLRYPKTLSEFKFNLERLNL